MNGGNKMSDIEFGFGLGLCIGSIATTLYWIAIGVIKR
jgi:hypothetical protein